MHIKACKQNMKVIKTTVSLKIKIKEKSPFLWFDLSLYAITKTIYGQKEKLTLNLIKQTVTLYLRSITSYRAFILDCKFQKVF